MSAFTPQQIQELNTFIQSLVPQTGAVQTISKPKLPQPSTFNGVDGDKISSWMDEMSGYLQYNKESIKTQEEQVMFATSYLRDGARDWWITVKESGNVPSTWNDFVTKIEHAYITPDRALLARQALFQLKQGTSTVKQYTDAFRTLALRCDISEKDKRYQYIQNLEPEVQGKVLQYTFVEAQEAALRFGSVQRVQQAYNSAHTTNTSSSIPMELSSLMELLQQNPIQLNTLINNIRKPREKLKLSPEEYKKRRDGNLCLKCGTSGHRIATCVKDFRSA